MENKENLDSIPQIITVGRISVDIYAQELYASFLDPQTFRKSIGGSPTNVAVAATRYGHHAAVVTKVGVDPWGDYIVRLLQEWGVDTRYIGRDANALTPVVFAALDPPEDPQILFYRGAAAPDTTVQVNDVPTRDIEDCRIFWMSVGALSQGATADSSLEWLALRGRKEAGMGETILDLDYRPTMWDSLAKARSRSREAINNSTIVLGNKAECEMALGVSEPDAAADDLLSRGVRLAIIKLGGGGVMLADQDTRIKVPPLNIDVVCGLGAGDAFGGALIHGVLSQWDLEQIGLFANGAGAYVATQLTCADAMPTEQVVRETIMFSEKRGKK
jgi:5-dehydro-2-deoxygluconokinase